MGCKGLSLYQFLRCLVNQLEIFVNSKYFATSLFRNFNILEDSNDYGNTAERFYENFTILNEDYQQLIFIRRHLA